MNYEKIVTLYDTAEHGEGARRSLEAAGFSPIDISMDTKKTFGFGRAIAARARALASAFRSRY
jgi:hypothetical protein